MWPFGRISALQARAIAAEESVWRLEIEVRGLKRQRDIVEEDAAAAAQGYLRQIELLRLKLAPFERARDAKGRIVGLPRSDK